MPFNVKQGDAVEITVTFFASSASQVVTTPTSATLTITYPTLANPLVTATATVDMSLSGSFFTATWGSSVAAYGLTTLSAAPASGAAVTDTLRVTP
jgi:hypothetical protein